MTSRTARETRSFAGIARGRATEPDLPPGSGEGTVLAILRAALSLFARHGYHATSVRDIAEAVGIKAPSLYAHFASKDEILARLVLIGHRSLLEEMQRALLETGNDPVAQTRALVRVHVRAHVTYPMLAIVTTDEMHNLPAELAAAAVALRQQGELLAASVAMRGVEAGVFDPPNLIATLAAIGSMGIRAAYWFEPSDAFTADDLAEVYEELALRMLEPRRP